jgi:hypothetical protein
VAVPILGALRLESFRKTLLASATFCRLMGNAGHPELAIDRTYLRIALDDGTNPPPRAVLREDNAMSHKQGEDSYLGNGRLTAYIEFEEFTLEEMNEWYGINETSLTLADHVHHLENLTTLIAGEIRAMTPSTVSGGIDMSGLEEGCGETDPISENGVRLFWIGLGVDWQGMP